MACCIHRRPFFLMPGTGPHWFLPHEFIQVFLDSMNRQITFYDGQTQISTIPRHVTPASSLAAFLEPVSSRFRYPGDLSSWVKIRVCLSHISRTSAVYIGLERRTVLTPDRFRPRSRDSFSSLSIRHQPSGIYDHSSFCRRERRPAARTKKPFALMPDSGYDCDKLRYVIAFVMPPSASTPLLPGFPRRFAHSAA